MTDQLPYFFFSYARADARDEPSLTQFYSDLLKEVRVLTGRPASTDLGFFDTRNIHIGSAWSDHLVEALSNCRLFLALCSASYFNSEYCGREWAAFSERIKWTEGTTGQRFPKLVPLLWTPIASPPAAMAAVQYDHYELGDLYSRRGIRHLLKLKRNADEYQEFLGALAERIVAMAEEDPLPPADVIVPFAQAPDVFGNRATIAELSAREPSQHRDPAAQDSSSQAASAAENPGVEDTGVGNPTPDALPSTVLPATDLPSTALPSTVLPSTVLPSTVLPSTALPAIAPPSVVDPTPVDPTPALRSAAGNGFRRRAVGGGPRVVTFVVAATAADELPQARRQRIYYGSRFEDWAPYQPHHAHGLCSAVQEVAGQQNMISTVAQLEPGISALLDRARGRNEIVVIVIDIWTTMMERFREPLFEYDRSNEPTTSVLVPWDSSDHETNDCRELLVTSLHEALERSLLRQDGLVQYEIHSYQHFRATLSRALVKLQSKIIEKSEIRRNPTGAPRTPPTIQGPLG